MDAGLDPAYFWQVTPKEAALILNGAASRLDRERDLLAWHAHTTAGLGRVSKFPRLKSILPSKTAKPYSPKPRPSWEQMLETAKQWTALINKVER